jgi:hypothetical protein
LLYYYFIKADQSHQRADSVVVVVETSGSPFHLDLDPASLVDLPSFLVADLDLASSSVVVAAAAVVVAKT